MLRTDIYNSRVLRDFLEIDLNYKEDVITPPVMVAELTGFLHSVRDFNIDYTNHVMFIVNSDTNVFTRLDAYMSNMKMPWESE